MAAGLSGISVILYIIFPCILALIYINQDIGCQISRIWL